MAKLEELNFNKIIKTEQDTAIVPMKKELNLIDSYDLIEIFEDYPSYYYFIKKPLLSDREKLFGSVLENIILKKASIPDLSSKLGLSKDFLNELNDSVIHEIESQNLLHVLPDDESFNVIKESFLSLAKKHLDFIVHPSELTDLVLGRTIGYGFLSNMVHDDWLEEIMVNGYDKPVFIFHRKYGMCETNVLIKKDGFIQRLLYRIASTVSRELTDSRPLLDARLPDGSRANATSPYATPFGPTLTIRKFSKTPLSIIDLINTGTMNAEIAAFLWVMVEGFGIEPMNIIITGGSGTGKTSTLNALSVFVRKEDRIITIEDTLELHLGERQNWIQMEARPEISGTQELSMDDLLKNALRMRPDRIILGEVRGPEAQTLFTAMDIGHSGCMGTVHSNNGRELITRLKSAPMNVPDIMLPLLDLIVVQYRMHAPGKGVIRRITQICEVSRMDEQTLLGELFVWRKEEDTIKQTSTPAHILEKIADRAAKTKKDVMKEIKIRQRILEWMTLNGIHLNADVQNIIQKYYYNSTELLEQVSEEL
ncbi:MAG: ATPase, T2SS/T4P/T4SS family [archaeon]